MPCKFPEHHKSGGSGGSALPVLAAVILGAAWIWHEIARTVGTVVHVLVLAAVALAAAAVLAAIAWVTVRLVRGHRPAPKLRMNVHNFAPEIRASRTDLGRWRYLPAAVWARIRWHHLTRNLGAARPDRHRQGKVRFPRARIYPDAHGIVARVKTIPGVGREDFEDDAGHIANAWRCCRVQVAQRKPGRLIVRGLKTDPLTQPFDPPPGVYGVRENVKADISPHRMQDVKADNLHNPLRLYLGRDEWGADRWLPLPGVTGITVGGLPGYGKTSLVRSWLMQLAGLGSVQFAIIDGKGGGDYAEWEDRSFIFAGDELPAAAAALEDVHSLMRTRLAHAGDGGPRNRWHIGPTADWPLVVTVIDECHTFYELEGQRGNREAEAHVRACRALTGQLVKKGRAPLFLTVLLTQKQTSDAIPTAIRDNCLYGLSFAVKTREAAVSSLGEHIREYPSYCPTTLQDPSYVGVATASLRTGQDPFVRIRVPEVTEAAAAARAAETASKRSDPRLTPEHLADPVRPDLAALESV